MNLPEIIRTSLALAGLRDNPALTPDPRGVILFKALRVFDPVEVTKAIIDTKSEITVEGKKVLALANLAAETENIKAEFGSGRRNAQDRGGFIGKYFQRLREKIAIVNQVAYRHTNYYATEWQLMLEYENNLRGICYEFGYIYYEGLLHQPTYKLLTEVGTSHPTDNEKLEVYEHQHKLYAFRLINNRWIWDRNYSPTLNY